MHFLRSIPPWAFPTVLIVLDLCASMVWLAHGNWRMAVY